LLPRVQPDDIGGDRHRELEADLVEPGRAPGAEPGEQIVGGALSITAR